ncbi:uncharacterized protein LOC102366236 isoform X2 [Latimeria chalumnae]|uniref:uncharacterized protein LOC102366236 isoform X2 n=1 Tax=Latimeria chalumnae TaxID=7897 RepID=UPI0003C11BE9|nr:PREDICTED: uncharacterized protein LOC102366236 isoform X1 [Latimeria chalumnae]|eukprot:XP_006011070.1 PREDICTED: uncharacterized protein LOC102366236 isoform X1 [Latimeria chalumnae]
MPSNCEDCFCRFCKMVSNFFALKILVLAEVLFLSTSSSADDQRYNIIAGSQVLLHGLEGGTRPEITLVSWSFKVSKTRIPDTILDYTPGDENYQLYSHKIENGFEFSKENFSLLLKNVKVSNSGIYHLSIYTGEGKSTNTRTLQVAPLDVMNFFVTECLSVELPGIEGGVTQKIKLVTWSVKAFNNGPLIAILGFAPGNRTLQFYPKQLENRFEFSKTNASLWLKNVNMSDSGIYLLSAYADEGNTVTTRSLRILADNSSKCLCSLGAEQSGVNPSNCSCASVGGLSFFTFCLGLTAALALISSAAFCRCCHSVSYVKECKQKIIELWMKDLDVKWKMKLRDRLGEGCAAEVEEEKHYSLNNVASQT